MEPRTLRREAKNKGLFNYRVAEGGLQNVSEDNWLYFNLVQIHFKIEVFSPDSLPDTATKHRLQLEHWASRRKVSVISIAVEYYTVRCRGEIEARNCI